MTEEGRNALIEIERLELEIYDDGAGVPSIGIGHKLTADDIATKRFINGITEAQAYALLDSDLAPAVSAVRRLVKVPLSSHQEDALTMFAFNVGTGTNGFAGSTLLKKLNTGDYASVPDEVRRWVFSKGKKMNGLVNRREAEIRIWSLPAKEGHAQ